MLSGLGEFATATRVVAWLGIEEGAEQLIELRRGLAACDRDVLPYSWRPHCTLLYAEQPDAYRLVTQGIGAAFLGHSITRVAVFLMTGHAGQPAPRGREAEDLAIRGSAPDGWSPVERVR